MEVVGRIILTSVAFRRNSVEMATLFNFAKRPCYPPVPDAGPTTRNLPYKVDPNRGGQESSPRRLSCEEQISKTQGEGQKLIKFLLLGKVGHGKSSTGNSLIGHKVFGVASSAKSVTQECSHVFGKCEELDFLVVDSPGLMDTEKHELDDIKAAVRNFGAALSMCYGSIHAFLIVIGFKVRITQEEASTIQNLQMIFGKGFLNHVIVIITGGDDFQAAMEDEDRIHFSFHDWCREQTGPLSDLFKACKHRVVLFNNRERSAVAKGAQRKKVIDMARDWEPYTAECFQRADKEREKFILARGASILKQEYQQAICGLELTIVDYIGKQSEDTKRDIEYRSNTLVKKIKDNNDNDSQKELMTTINKILDNLDNPGQLIKLRKKLEDIRRAPEKWNKIGNILLAVGIVASLVSIGAFVPVLIGATAATATAVAVAEGTSIVATSAVGASTAIRIASVISAAGSSFISAGSFITSYIAKWKAKKLARTEENQPADHKSPTEKRL